jgi:hypothetical protein
MRSRFLPLLALLLAFPAATPLSAQSSAQDSAAAEARDAAAIEWVRLVVVDGDYEAAAALAHPDVASQMTASVLRSAWAQLGPQLGALASLEPQAQGMEQGFQLVVLTGDFAAGTFDVLVYMNEQHQVAGFFVRPPGA